MFHPLAPSDDGLASDEPLPDVRYAGRCPVSGEERWLGPTREAIEAARHLEAYLEMCRVASDGFSTAHLLAPGAGKMFGVLVCRNGSGALGTLRAFSGEWDTWETPPGWAPSPGRLEEYADARRETEDEVARLTARIEELKQQPTSRPLRRQIEQIKIERGRLSRALTDRIHDAYRFENALGETLRLVDVDFGSPRPPTGTGDCCAPKLLQAAIREGLEPLGMVEFWWGAPSAMFPRETGVFHSACREKCYPILGFLLRGVAAAHPGPVPLQGTRGAT